MTTFGDRLRALREGRGWSQEKLGFEMDVTKSTVSKWEGNRAEPGLSQLAKLRRLFAPEGLSLDFLIVGDAEDDEGGNRTREMRGPYATPNPRQADSADEQVLLLRYRAMDERKRKHLLGLLA